MSHYRGQLFRLNFQRLISPASTRTILTVTFSGNEISCAHIEVYLKKFFSHSGVSQVFSALGASFLNINTNNIKEPCLPKGVCEPRIAFWKGLFTTNGPTQSNITKRREDSKSVELRKATGSNTQTTEQVTEEEMLDSLPGNVTE